MKTLAVAALAFPLLAVAQSRPFVPQSQGALGGSYAGQGSSRPLGGIAPPGFVPARPQPVRPRYITPVYYVPNAFGTTFASEAEASHYDSNYHPVVSNAPFVPPPPPTARGVQFSGSEPVPQPQTVIVNNYYNGENKVSPVRTETAETRDYYLIAYRNRNVITALAYWVDGDTLHYVSSQNSHNQSSLALIDLEMTRRLNADREVPFAVPTR